PTTERMVRYGRLAPGHYRFDVRAVDRDGLTSARPAGLAFEIPPPIWRRWWFLASAAAAALAVGYALHRARVRRLLALEGVRRQIATDLHDDIGSGLSQIAVLSEVAKRVDGEARTGRLDVIAGLARALRDSMSDIVWAVDPRHDRFTDLVQRMRHV